MRSWSTLVVALALTVPAIATTTSAASDCAAPCGWINPIIDLEFPDKADCGGGLVLGQDAGPDACMVPPGVGESLTLDGVIRWYWDVSYEGTYPADPTQDIVLDFGKTSTHPSWLDFSIEPSTFTIDNSVLLDAQYYQTRETGGSTPAVYYWFEQPISITFTRTGEPSTEDLDRMRHRDGVQAVFVKAHSTASGSQIRESYGIEEFLFHAANDPELESVVFDESDGTPGIGALALLAGVGAAAFVARRRQEP